MSYEKITVGYDFDSAGGALVFRQNDQIKVMLTGDDAFIVHQYIIETQQKYAVAIPAALESLERRQEDCWRMLATFLENRDAHGCHDMGVEIQALQRAAAELEKLK